MVTEKTKKTKTVRRHNLLKNHAMADRAKAVGAFVKHRFAELKKAHPNKKFTRAEITAVLRWAQHAYKEKERHGGKAPRAKSVHKSKSGSAPASRQSSPKKPKTKKTTRSASSSRKTTRASSKPAVRATRSKTAKKHSQAVDQPSELAFSRTKKRSHSKKRSQAVDEPSELAFSAGIPAVPSFISQMSNPLPLKFSLAYLSQPMNSGQTSY
jgi:hypothetical protein